MKDARIDIILGDPRVAVEMIPGNIPPARIYEPDPYAEEFFFPFNEFGNPSQFSVTGEQLRKMASPRASEG